MSAAPPPAAARPLDRLLDDVRRPTLLLDEARARANIAAMVARMRRADVRLRPHFKTHVSAAIGEWFRDAGVAAITVTSLEMARYFADAGWRDITIAMPLHPRRVDEIAALARRVDLGVLVDDAGAAAALAAGIDAAVRAWIKVDAGYGRAGIRWDDPAAIAAVIERLERGGPARFAGLLSHAGDSYAAAGPAEIRRVHRRTVEHLTAARAALRARGHDGGELSIGDTPCCSLAAELDGVDEARPGNFVFHDLMQLELGVCAAAQIAVAVACPVIGRYPARHQLLLHGGAIHFSKDRLAAADGSPIYGYRCPPTGDGFGPPDRRARLTALSQEHGLLTVEPSAYDELARGDAVLVLPVHSCLTAHQFPGYRTLDGRFLRRAPLAELLG